MDTQNAHIMNLTIVLGDHSCIATTLAQRDLPCETAYVQRHTCVRPDASKALQTLFKTTPKVNGESVAQAKIQVLFKTTQFQSELE
eukprot:4800156-Amphidinium_carterae.1